MSGIDSTGFTKKTLPEIRRSLVDKAIIKFGPTINTSEDSVLGKLIDIFAAETAISWDGLEGVFSGFNVSKSEGTVLDDLSEIVGVQRIRESSSLTTVIITGDLGVTIPLDSLISVTTTKSQFSTDTTTTFSILDPTQAIINIDTITNNTTYTVTINGTTVSFTSNSNATVNEITAGLSQSVNFSKEQINVTALDNINSTINITSDIIITAPAITNLILQSEDITTVWTDIGTPTVTINDTQFVDGNITADKLNDNDGAAFEGKTQSINIISSTDDYVISCFLRSDTLNRARLRLQFTGGSPLDGNVRVNIDTQVIIENGDVFPSSSTVELLENGWVRLSFRMNDNGTGNTTAIVEINAGDTASDTGDIHVSGFQLERGVVTSSDYIPTIASIVTRDATIASISNIPNQYILTIDGKMSINKVSTLSNITAIDTGLIAAPISTLVNIDTPVFGWDSVINPDAAILGRGIESDTVFRQRRFQSVQIAGAGTVSAIESNVRQLPTVTDAFIIENRDIIPDGDGRPGKSFETIVNGGVNQDIGQKIWDTKAVGIETFGTTTIIAIDAQGDGQIVKFSRPNAIFLHLEIDYTLNLEEVFPTNGEDTIRNIATTTGGTLGIGEDVIIQKFFGPIFSGVTGIATLDIRQAISLTEFGLPGVFSNTNLVVDATELSNFNITRVAVTKV